MQEIPKCTERTQFGKKERERDWNKTNKKQTVPGKLGLPYGNRTMVAKPRLHWSLSNSALLSPVTGCSNIFVQRICVRAGIQTKVWSLSFQYGECARHPPGRTGRKKGSQTTLHKGQLGRLSLSAAKPMLVTFRPFRIVHPPPSGLALTAGTGDRKGCVPCEQ